MTGFVVVIVICIKVFFRYSKFYSVTTMLTELNLHNFDSLINVEVILNVRSMHVTMALYSILYMFAPDVT